LCSLTDEGQWRSVIDTAIARYGKIDILVNNAGFAAFHSTEESSLEDWNRVMDLCVKSIFLGCKFILPAMQKADGGYIVNISSIAGMAVTWRNSPTAVPIVASAATGTSGADPCRPRIGAAPADGLSWRPATA
jgi:NADP-dependent 3-hydroxy acid dehydrogenase YdfG